MRPGRRIVSGVVVTLLAAGLLAAQQTPELADYKTVENCITTKVVKSRSNSQSQPGFLGINVFTDERGSLVIEQVAEQSPASAAGLRKGDVVVKVAGQAPRSADALRDLLLSKEAGDQVSISITRGAKTVDLTATLGATSRPKILDPERGTLGVTLADPVEGQGALVEKSGFGFGGPGGGKGGKGFGNRPASALKSGDVILKIDGKAVASAALLSDILGDKKPGETVLALVRRDGKEQEIKVPLVQDPMTRMTAGDRPLGYWKKDVYRLAVISIEYPDVKHNDKISPKDWEEALFSRSVYVNRKSVTGQPVYGSMNDYYQEISYGKLRVEGKAFPWVQVSKKRTEYGQSTSPTAKSALLVEALDGILKRDGQDALDNFDGIFFMYAGNRVQTNRGGLYWPHRASFTHKDKRWSYFICPEGGDKMDSISVISHEFGHMLGLPDLYARPEAPGSEGVGVWCTMSNGHGNKGRPLHFSAWCKEMLGWCTPTIIDPTVKQKLILAPIIDSPKECYKILVRPDGSEYLLLENRIKKNFDEDLPGQGLLIWRVVGGRPILEESHGVAGPNGPRVFLGTIPYPSAANTAFTPFTTPSSRSQLGGGAPVYITNIRKLPDGRITFHIGFEYF